MPGIFGVILVSETNLVHFWGQKQFGTESLVGLACAASSLQ